MNIIKKLTYENLRRNPKRTIVTIIGVILSTALLCAAAGLVTSGRQSMIEYAKAVDGDFHVMFDGVPAGQLGYVTENANVEKSFTGRIYGYAKAESTNEYKPYFYVIGTTQEGMQKMALHLLEGRLPENGSEILVSGHVRSNGGMMISVGDVLDLSVGTRIAEDGTVLDQMVGFDPEVPEEIADPAQMSFTVVGVITRPNSGLEPWSAPGYTLVTYAGEEETAGDAPCFAGVRFKSLKGWREKADKIASTVEAQSGQSVRTLSNTSVMKYEGALSESSLTMIYAVGTIVILIILTTSIFVIRNSFAISVAEKTAQYGMLSSVGATSKQIRDSVLYEGFLIGLVGIPLGIAGGTLALAVLTRIVNLLLPTGITELVFTFSLPWYAILASVLLGAVTIYLSSLIPAIRAGKIAPIEAIRGNDQIKISGKKVRISPLTGKIFGIGGVIAAKNLKRSRSKYRTTVISLVVSTAVFIALSSFVDYTKRATGVVYEDYQYNITVSGLHDLEKAHSLMEEMGEEDWSVSAGVHAKVDPLRYGSEMTKEEWEDIYASLTEEEKENTSFDVELSFLDERTFQQMAKECGVTSDYEHTVLLCDTAMRYHEDGSRTQVKLLGDLEGETVELQVETSLEEDEKTGETRSVYETIPVTVSRRSEKMPRGQEGWNGMVLFLVSEHYLDDQPELQKKLQELMFVDAITIKAGQPDAVQKQLEDLRSQNLDYSGIVIYNLEANARQERNFILLIEIFLYGFITVITLVGVTNIFNTISTNMILRSKEFAMLRSIGMTTKQFHRMIQLESLLYGMRSLLWGIPLGLAGSYLIYLAFASDLDLGYLLPWKAILLAVVFVFLIVGVTMWYSLGKIEKQNIVETIRNDSI